MNEELFTLIDSVLSNNDIDDTFLNDNTIFKDVTEMVCDIYKQFAIMNEDIRSQIMLILENKQNRVLDPEYNESDIKYLTNKIKHLEKIPQPEQRSEEWYEFRNNRLTASDFYSVIDKKSVSKVKQLIYKKCGGDVPFLTNDAILHGVKFEPIATAIYEKKNDLKILEFGCIPHPLINFFGASPDGIVSYDSNNKNYIGRMLEIKCPKSRKITGIIPPAYFAQIQGQLEVCDLQYCDFLECDFQIYVKDDYLADTTHDFKGVIVELYNTDISKPIYHYYDEKEDLEKWEKKIIDTIFADGNDGLEYVGTIYWYLNKYNVVLVERDLKYFSSNYENIENFWKEVLKYREIGIDKLDYSKNKPKPYKPPKELELQFLD